MGLFDRRKHRRENMLMVRRVMNDTGEKPRQRPRSFALRGAVLLSLSALFGLICFWGRPSHLPILLPESNSRVLYKARFGFTYTSRVIEERLRESARLTTEPVPTLAIAKSEETKLACKRLVEAASDAFDTLKNLPPTNLPAQCEKIVLETHYPGIASFTAANLARLVEYAPSKQHFNFLLNAGQKAVTSLLDNGIHENDRGSLRLELSVKIEDARRFLRDTASTLAANEGGTAAQTATLRNALASIFSPALFPNVEIDAEATRRRQREVADKVSPPLIEIREGETLLSPGETVTPEILERWDAYRQQSIGREKAAYTPLRAIEENFIPSFGIILIAAIFAQLCPPSGIKRRHLTLALLMVPANLALIRAVIELGASRPMLHALPNPDIIFWTAPPALAAILVAAMTGHYLAIFSSFLVSAFAALMLGHSLDVLLVFTFASFTGVWFARNARDRSAVLRAGAISGIATALPVFLICKTGSITWDMLTLQTLACFISGLLTGMFAIGIIPFLERIFKITTNITLIELTDYNHELLRKLQLIAPGTFNHSVAVANIAEAAAANTSANALLCRCAALFHDIGKTMKPEYFVENQHEDNPHSGVSPTMSSLIIKSHVRDGVRIAKEYALPRAIIDIIEQHHGTGLILFFYHKAKKQISTTPDAGNGRTVDEISFRYDGPRPRSKEAAIVLFADSLEAASRSMKNPTPTTINELVDHIFSDRIRDGQLDECPLTFSELRSIRESIKASLLNLLHHRIEYPKEENAK
ncbi:MAG: HDIG domain-containing protein [Puniceicoccales bacterium]|jgi:putative nucleotidyltransferase with HDIG domain|nr:HDIG domain-containing protein [Puniceicoccales bacterium]